MGIIDEILKEKGISKAELSRETGISKVTITEWSKGRYLPKMDKLMKVAEYLDVPVEVFKEDGEKEKLNRRIKAYNEAMEKMPLYKVAAGEGAYNEQIPTEYEDMDDDDSDEYSWCEIVGDSMFPELKDGDRVKVHHQTETEKTDLTVVKVDGEHATVKFVGIVENGVWLRAINKDVYEDRFFTIKDVVQLPITIVGKVVEVRRKY